MVDREASRRILYVWDADYPWDVRTEKVCRALVEAGHPVAIAARNAARRPIDEVLPEGRVYRMRPLRRLGQALDRQLSFPAFFNPRWISHLIDAARRHGADLIMVRDLPLAPTALWVARHLGMPVVLDMAENYPAMIRDNWRTGRAKPLDVLVRNPSLISMVERYVLPRMDHVITVVEESSDRVASLGVPRGRITCVSNRPPAARATEPRSQAEAASGAVRFTYLGLMEMPRGIIDVLEATATLERDGLSVAVDLIGDGRDLALFRSRAEALGLSTPSVRFLGRLENREALRMVASADVGLVPHHADESWNTTIPNKLFDYMAAGLPVITSDAIPAARVVREAGAGLVYRSQDATDLARCMRALADPALRSKLGDAGRRAIRREHNWETDTIALLSVVRCVERTASL
jgi:glycosyltransferase involved in cell wall biosynthesis